MPYGILLCAVVVDNAAPMLGNHDQKPGNPVHAGVMQALHTAATPTLFRISR